MIDIHVMSNICHVMSNICHVCAKGAAPTDYGYHEWHIKHTPVCQLNFTGSANAMEIEAARIMFNRFEVYNLRYTQILCDGDSKTVTSLNASKIYNEVILKENCVNHVRKRLYNGIDKAKQNSKGNKQHLSGKGRITQKLQKQLSVSYMHAIKDGAHDVNNM